jgi:hypothetical protein
MEWRKSTYSTGSGGQCVTVGQLAEGIGVKDSQNWDGGTLAVSASAWASLVTRIKQQ